ncbi:MAG: hypothetical protein KC493_11780 [Bacteriovoracaceae bacterium]|nr:hypothetical protein [Bacteriovoracaceae bacterium]
MKVIIVSLSLIFSLNSMASCYDLLTYEPPYDSKSFFINEALSSVDAEDLNPSSATRILKNLLSIQVGCSEKSTSNLKVEASCSELRPGRSWSKVCFIESNLGYFTVQMNMMEGAHVIFNRWD